jgi:exoribonuclease R
MSEDLSPRPPESEEHNPVPCSPLAERGPVFSQKNQKPAFSILTREVHATLPLGVYALRIVPFECQLEGGAFRALHIRLDLPPEKERSFDRWWSDFETRFDVRIHPTKEWANRGIDNLLRGIAGNQEILIDKDIPALNRRLQHFDQVPGDRQVDPLLKPIPLDKGRDLTDLPHITIDPATTLDREDAIYAIVHPDGNASLYISFVDVTWYAQRHTPVDEHIASRAYSVYGSYSAFPLLGRDFAFGPGSFIPHEPRLAWTFELTVAPHGEIMERKFYRAAVVSRGAYTVEEVQRILTAPEGDNATVLSHLCEVSHRLSQWRRKGNRFIVVSADERKAAQIVSECMITANIEAANLLEQHGRDGIFTTYAPPSVSQQEQLGRRIKKAGIEVEPRHFCNAADFTTLWDTLRKAGQHSILSEMLDRFFPRSLFSSIPHNHQGIPARAYLRLKGNTYVGIVNQWIFEALHEGKSPPFSSDELEKIGHRQNRLMRSYDSAAFQLRFLEMLKRNLARQGETFSATVAEIQDERILFELNDDGFKKWGIAFTSSDYQGVRKNGSESSPHDKRLSQRQLSPGDTIQVTLAGFHRGENRFLFSVVEWHNARPSAPEFRGA